MKAHRKIIVYIATSADGYIARPNGDVEWLNRRPRKFDYGMTSFYRTEGMFRQKGQQLRLLKEAAETAAPGVEPEGHQAIMSGYTPTWNDGKLIGTPKVALKVAFFMDNGLYDFSRDLSTIVYARSSGHADLFLLSQK
jgi:hypothetical protein